MSRFTQCSCCIWAILVPTWCGVNAAPIQNGGLTPAWINLEFEGAQDLMATVRTEWNKRTLPPECDSDRQIATNREWRAKQKLIQHGGSPGSKWYGHSLPGVGNGSCNFLRHTFRAPSDFVTKVLKQQVYVSPGQMRDQCTANNRTRYNKLSASECSLNNYGIMYASALDCQLHSFDSLVPLGQGRRCRGSKCLTRGSLEDIIQPMIEMVTGDSILPPFPYLVYTKDAAIGGAGILTSRGRGANIIAVETDGELYVVACSPYWQRKTEHAMGEPHGQDVQELYKACKNTSMDCPVPREKKVIAIAQIFENQYFHFMIEIWPRIAPFIDGIMADPELKIWSSPNQENTRMQMSFFELLGIGPERIVAGPVFAEEVLIPRVGYSHNPHLNMWNLYALRHAIEKIHGVESPNVDGTKTILIVKRDTGRRLDHTYFNDAFGMKLEESLPGYKVQWFKATNKTLMHCLFCQVRRFQKADVIIGSHGAGLSHLLWAKRGAVVIERLVSADNSLIYAEMSFIFGLKYFPVTNFPPEEVADIVQYALYE